MWDQAPMMSVRSKQGSAIKFISRIMTGLVRFQIGQGQDHRVNRKRTREKET
jgi:hypothetical protein